MKLPKNTKIKYKGVEIGQCHKCRQMAPVEWHHMIYGKGRRPYSDHFDLVRQLCRECHRAAHSEKQTSWTYKMIAQKQFEEEHTHEEYMEIFAVNYL